MAAWPSGHDISHFSQFGVICKFSEGTLIHHPYCYEDAEQDRIQYWPLRYTAGHWHPTRLGLLTTTIWPQQIQLIFRLLHCFLLHQRLLYGTVRGESVTGTTVVQVDNSLCSCHVHQASHFIKVYQVGNTRLPINEAMLNAPHPLLLTHLCRDQNRGDQTIDPWVLPALLEDSSDICFSQVFWCFSKSPWWIKDYGQWP